METISVYVGVRPLFHAESLHPGLGSELAVRAEVVLAWGTNVSDSKPP